MVMADSVGMIKPQYGKWYKKEVIVRFRNFFLVTNRAEMGRPILVYYALVLVS